MKLKNKIFLTLILLSLIIISLCSNVFAAEPISLIGKSNYDIIVNFNAFDLDFSKLNHKAILFDSQSNFYYFYASDDLFTIRDKTEDDVLNAQNYNSSIVLELGSNNTTLYNSILSSDDFIIDDELKTITLNSDSNRGTSDVNFIRTQNNGLMEIPIYRNGSWLTDYSGIDTSIFEYSGNAVFTDPSQEITLAPIVAGVETEKTLAQVVAILPIVLIVIVGILAVRKAIKFLKTLLT